MKTLLLSLLLIPTLSFALGDSTEEMNDCLLFSEEKEVCEMLECKFISGTSRRTGAAATLCVSSDRVKFCFKKKKKQHNCLRSGCFYNFDRNLCYPAMMEWFEFSPVVTTKPADHPYYEGVAQ